MYGQYSSDSYGSITHSDIARNLEGKRVAKTLENPAHAWAHQSQTFGQSAKGNFYFHGPSLYSYGSHFLVGFRIMPDGDRHGGVALLNTDKHSVTTNRHQSNANHATRNLAQFAIPELTELRDDLKANPAELEDYQRNRISNHVKRHLEDYSGESAIYMLSYAGFSKPETILAKWRKDAAKAKLAADNREVKRELAGAVFMARATQDILKDKSRLPEFCKAAIERMIRDNGARDHTLEQQIKKARKAHKQLPKTTHGKLKASMWQLIKILLAAEKTGIEKNRKYHANVRFRECVETFRRQAERYAKYRDSTDPDLRRDSHDLRAWLDSADFIAGFVSHRPKLAYRLRASLAVTAAEIRDLYNQLVTIERAEIAAKNAALKAEHERKLAERKTDWLLGAPVHFNGTDEAGGAYLRIKADKLETSLGADIPLADAIRAFKLLARCKASQTAWHRNGQTMPVGVYQIDAIYPNGDFKAGCHLIRWPEVERIAASLGLLESVQ